MSRVLDKRLSHVHDDLIKMASIVEKQIFNSVEALKNHDEVLANKIIKNDDVVDSMQKQLEEKSIKLIAQNQPLATDLRNIFTTTKIVTDLERMADHAVDIAKIVLKIGQEPYIKKLSDIILMAEKVQHMIKFSIDTYISGDVEEAYKICIMDNEVDHLCSRIFDELMRLSVQEINTNQISQLLFVSKYLERVADHCTNICEFTIYLKTGNYVDLNE